MKKKLMIAFWRYDLFPHWKWGVVVEKNALGHVETREYGKGFWFEPVKILPYEEAKEICIALSNIEQQRSDALKAINSLSRNLLNSVQAPLLKK